MRQSRYGGNPSTDSTSGDVSRTGPSADRLNSQPLCVGRGVPALHELVQSSQTAMAGASLRAFSVAVAKSESWV